MEEYETNNNPEQSNINPNDNSDTQNIVDTTQKGINTSALPQDELNKLVNENPDLKPSIEELEQQEKEKLIADLQQSDNILSILVKSNTELKSKIEMSNEKYNQILENIKSKENEPSEKKLTLQIQELEKEIKANQTETESYKRKIDKLRNKIEFKANLDRAFNVQNLLKAETLKNQELKSQLRSLERITGIQNKYINDYDKENQISEKITILKEEIEQNKKCIKDYQDKFTKQDRFIRLIHEKILSLEMMIRNMKEEKPEKAKQFTKEQLQNTLDEIESLKKKIEVNRSVLNSTTKNNEMRMHNLLEKNKEIEVNYKKSEKENKKLVFTKNELKRKIRMLNGNEGKGLYRGGGYNAEKMHKEMIVAKDQVNEEGQQEVQMEGGDDERKEVLVQGIEQEQGEDVDVQVNGEEEMNMEVNVDNVGNVEIEKNDGNEIEQDVNEGENEGKEEEVPPQDQDQELEENRVEGNDEV